MKFVRETSGANVVRAYEPGLIQVNQQSFRSSIIISPEQVVPDWQPPDAQSVSIESLRAALDLEPEILILGTGAQLVFPVSDLHGQLAASGIGLEVMATAAACRTYNVLAHEGRPVVAALINET